MAHEITIDASGRLVIPKEIRDLHHLEAGARLMLVEEENRLVLVPKTADARLVEQDGLLVVAGIGVADVPDHRVLRDERLARLAGST